MGFETGCRQSLGVCPVISLVPGGHRASFGTMASYLDDTRGLRTRLLVLPVSLQSTVHASARVVSINKNVSPFIFLISNPSAALYCIHDKKQTNKQTKKPNSWACAQDSSLFYLLSWPVSLHAPVRVSLTRVLGLLNRLKLIRGQTRNADKGLLGPLLQQGGARTSNRFPCSLPKRGV